MRYYSDNIWTPYVESIQVVYSGVNQKVYFPKLPEDAVLEVVTVGVYSPALGANRSTFVFMEANGTRIASNSLLVNSGIGRLHQVFLIVPPNWLLGLEIIAAAADERFYISATGKLHFPVQIDNEPVIKK